MKNLKVPSAGHSHCLWDDMLKYNILPDELTPIQPGDQHQSPAPPADPEDQKLKNEEKQSLLEFTDTV